MPESDSRSWTATISFPAGEDQAEGLGRVSALFDGLDEWLRGVPGLDAAGVGDLRLVCDELGSNLIRHGVRERDVNLTVEAEFDAEWVRLRLTDDGGEFNPFVHTAPYMGSDLDKWRIGGLGLFLVRQLFPLARHRRLSGNNVAEVDYALGENGKGRMRRVIDSPFDAGR